MNLTQSHCRGIEAGGPATAAGPCSRDPQGHALGDQAPREPFCQVLRVVQRYIFNTFSLLSIVLGVENSAVKDKECLTYPVELALWSGRQGEY